MRGFPESAYKSEVVAALRKLIERQPHRLEEGRVLRVDIFLTDMTSSPGDGSHFWYTIRAVIGSDGLPYFAE